MKIFRKLPDTFRKIGLPLLAVLVLSTACDPNDDSDPSASDKSINEWILQNMKTYYLWTDHIPVKTNQSLSPSEYFETLLYERGRTDRFSHIQENYLELRNSIAGVNTEAGYVFKLLRWGTTNYVVGVITYIKPGSPAANTSLKRGDFFATFNGVQLTMDNYQELLGQRRSPHRLGIADPSILHSSEMKMKEEISLQVANFAENPVLLDSIYTVQDKKIGYLVYNLFADDKGDGSLTYVKELNTLFGKFKTAGIQELVVDLRYNPGGTLTTAQAFASMISNRPATDVLAVTQYNALVSSALAQELGKDYDKDYFLDYLDKTPINKLQGLNRVYFLVSDGTASASELLINGLRPYMQVRLIGTTTYGKNVGSWLIYETDKEKQKKNTWGLLPITFRIANSTGFSDYANGFKPDIEVDEWENLPFKALGDTEETVLKYAINDIAGNSTFRAPGSASTKFTGSPIDIDPARKNLYTLLPLSGKIREIINNEIQ